MTDKKFTNNKTTTKVVQLNTTSYFPVNISNIPVENNVVYQSTDDFMFQSGDLIMKSKNGNSISFVINIKEVIPTFITQPVITP